MKIKSSTKKELNELKKEIKQTQDKLDDAIMYFNRNNNEEDERLIEKYKKEVKKLNDKKIELEEQLFN
jgi:uncharacterized protein YecE (DUF72 family)